jgi:hypothetical protein
MTTTPTRPAVPLPAGAKSADRWEVDDRDERVTRMFSNAERGTVIRVGIMGKQDYSGDVLYRNILIDVSNKYGLVDVDAAGARQIAADLLAAADELARLQAQR